MDAGLEKKRKRRETVASATTIEKTAKKAAKVSRKSVGSTPTATAKAKAKAKAKATPRLVKTSKVTTPKAKVSKRKSTAEDVDAGMNAKKRSAISKELDGDDEDEYEDEDEKEVEDVDIDPEEAISAHTRSHDAVEEDDISAHTRSHDLDGRCLATVTQDTDELSHVRSRSTSKSSLSSNASAIVRANQTPKSTRKSRQTPKKVTEAEAEAEAEAGPTPRRGSSTSVPNAATQRGSRARNVSSSSSVVAAESAQKNVLITTVNSYTGPSADGMEMLALPNSHPTSDESTQTNVVSGHLQSRKTNQHGNNAASTAAEVSPSPSPRHAGFTDANGSDSSLLSQLLLVLLVFSVLFYLWFMFSKPLSRALTAEQQSRLSALDSGADELITKIDKMIAIASKHG
jgi:hypothetical protein